MYSFSDKEGREVMEAFNKIVMAESGDSWMARLHGSFNEKVFGGIVINVLNAVKTTSGMGLPKEKVLKKDILLACEAVIDDLLRNWDDKYYKGQ